MAPCVLCPPSNPNRALLRRPKTLQPVCKPCFFAVFEQEIHHAIIGHGQAEQQPNAAPSGSSSPSNGRMLFKRGEKVAIGASGGKGQFSSPSSERVVALGKVDSGADCCGCFGGGRRLDGARAYHDAAE